MDAAALKAFEDRANSAEQRLAALENKLANGLSISSNAATDNSSLAQRYLSELEGLRAALVAAQAEQATQDARITELETANSKLAYQIVHLKRAVQESDAKLKSVGLRPS